MSDPPVRALRTLYWTFVLMLPSWSLSSIWLMHLTVCSKLPVTETIRSFTSPLLSDTEILAPVDSIMDFASVPPLPMIAPHPSFVAKHFKTPGLSADSSSPRIFAVSTGNANRDVVIRLELLLDLSTSTENRASRVV